jgi:hypothetical protein
MQFLVKKSWEQKKILTDVKSNLIQDLESI